MKSVNLKKNRNVKCVSKITFKLEDYKAEDNAVSVTKKNSLTLLDQPNSEPKKGYKSHYKFLSDVQAFTIGNFNLIAGRTGQGKTDLIVSMAVSNLVDGHSVAIFISEGNISDYKRQIEFLIKEKRNLLAKIIVFDERLAGLNKYEDPIKWNTRLFTILSEYKINFFYFDNLSTCKFTRIGYETEALFSDDLAQKVKNSNLCFIGLIHSIKNCSPIYEIKIEEIRGSANHVNLATNVFALNNFMNLDRSLRVIKTLKARDFGDKIGLCYKILYKKLKFRGYYQKDEKITEIETRRHFAQNNRHKLSGPN